MNQKPEFTPADLGDLEDKAEAILNSFRKANDQDRSPEYRDFHLKSAEQITSSLVSDFGYYFDKYKIGGIVPYGLNELIQEKLSEQSQDLKIILGVMSKEEKNNLRKTLGGIFKKYDN